MLTATFPDVALEMREAAAFGVARGRQPETAVTLAMEEQKIKPEMEMSNSRDGFAPAEALSDADFLELLENWTEPPMAFEPITPPEAAGTPDVDA